MIDAPEAAGAKTAPRLNHDDYLRFSSLLLERYGLLFHERRRPELELGIRHAFAASTCTDLDEYYHLLLDPKDGGVEMDQLINAVTVNETHFFRDAGQFDALYQHVLPGIIARRRPLHTLRIWSAGCASGEEPYSIAMLLRELLPDIDEWAITILATDINTEALDRARKAVYGEWAFRETRAKEWRSRYFQAADRRYRLEPTVQRMVTFARLNLAEPRYPAYDTNTTQIDLIVCRNVTIYFDETLIHEVVKRFYDALVDNGWLVVGHSEPSVITYRRFQACNYPNAILYQRTGQPTALPPDWQWLSPESGAAKPPEPLPVLSQLPPAPDWPTLHLPEPQATPVTRDPLEQARELLDFGHSEAARDTLLAVVKSHPDQAAVCALLGHAQANLGAWPEAEDWCRQAIRHNKLLLDAYHTLALVLQHQRRLDEAIEAMKKVVYIDHNNVLGHFGLASLYRSQGQLSQAQKSLDNTRRLLDIRAADEAVSGSGGVTVGRLREAVIRQQQQWGAEARSAPKGSQ